VAECYNIPAVPAVPSVPPRTIGDPNIGWNAGGRSVGEEDGDCYVEFDMPSVAGAVVGLANERRGTDPAFVPFAFAFTNAGPAFWRIVEWGVPLTDPVAYTSGAVFKIRRRGSVVIYSVDGDDVYASLQSSAGTLLVVGLLFVATDTVGVPA
jgi:hypothetical protein